MNCPKCGAQNPDDAKLCQSCNWVLGSTACEPQPDAKTSKMAVTSLVLAILSPFTLFISLLPAVIFGIISLVKIEKSGGRLKGKGLAIGGIASAPAILIVTFFLIMLPALGRVREMANRVVCGSNMSGLGKAMLIYSNDWDDRYPTGSQWNDLLVEHADMPPESFHCRHCSNISESNIVFF